MTDDLRFDELLREDAAALPPPSDSAVNPWQTAMSQILWGMGLTTITLNLLYLDYILPALGAVLLVLGFRTLRRENAPLGWCYRLSLAALLLRGTAYVLLSLPVELDKTLAYCTSLVTLALYTCLWWGMVGVSRSAGAEKPAAPAAGAMAVLYGLLLPLAYIGLEGWLLVVPLLVIYIVLLRNMAKLSRSLADTGYVITAAPVRLPGWAVLWGSLGLLLASVLLAAFLGQRYPTDWQARKDAPQDETIRQELLELGFPEAVLNDLTADEVAALDGAAAVSPGDTVTAGQLLISGAADSPRGVRLMRATGTVRARTWYTLTVPIPLAAEERAWESGHVLRLSLDAGRRRIKFYGGGSVPGTDCAKITAYHPLTLPFGLRLPLSLVTERIVSYDTAPARNAAEAAQREGEAQLLHQLQETIGEDGTVVKTEFSREERGGWLYVTLRAECEEQIGTEVPLITE